MRHLLALRRDNRGSVVLIFALATPVLLGLSAAALEYGSLVKRRSELQRAADSGAIAGVNQFKLANTEDAAAINSAVSMGRAQAQTDAPADRTTAVEAVVGDRRASVQVTVRETVPLSFGKLLNMANVEISAQSTARLAGTTRLCLLSLDPKAKKAFSAEKNARIAAPDCSLYSNSKSPEGISAGDGAVATALTMCSAGGYKGTSANFVPPPATQCPQLKDPLADRAPPPIGACVSLGSMNVNYADSTKTVKLAKGAYTLNPGTYCNGLEITDGALVTLNPGVYVMKNGPLVVKTKASMTGQNVGFYFTGDRGGLLFDKDSIVSLTAPKDGDMASLLFFEERSVSSSATPPEPDDSAGPKPPAPPAPETDTPIRQYRIISDNARQLLGTIYLPAGRLVIDSKKPVADQSAYTVVVARLVNLYEGPNLVLNARYGSSDVPVPEGVGPSSADTVLTQ